MIRQHVYITATETEKNFRSMRQQNRFQSLFFFKNITWWFKSDSVLQMKSNLACWQKIGTRMKQWLLLLKLQQWAMVPQRASHLQLVNNVTWPNLFPLPPVVFLSTESRELVHLARTSLKQTQLAVAAAVFNSWSTASANTPIGFHLEQPTTFFTHTHSYAHNKHNSVEKLNKKKVVLTTKLLLTFSKMRFSFSAIASPFLFFTRFFSSFLQAYILPVARTWQAQTWKNKQ